jgi:hypothetical protein
MDPVEFSGFVHHDDDDHRDNCADPKESFTIPRVHNSKYESPA